MTDDQYREVGDLARPEKGSSLTFGRVVALVALLAFLVFIIQNTSDTTVRFMGWDFTLSFWLLGLIIFALGWTGGYFSKSRKVRAARKAMK